MVFNQFFRIIFLYEKEQKIIQGLIKYIQGEFKKKKCLLCESFILPNVKLHSKKSNTKKKEKKLLTIFLIL